METGRPSGYSRRFGCLDQEAAKGKWPSKPRAFRPETKQEAASLRLLLDTSVLIDALRGRKDRRALLKEFVQAGHILATTSLNVAEVYAGMRANEEAATESFLNALECFELTASAGRLAGRLVSEWRQRGRTLELPDTVVAAICIEKDCVLVTDNRRDFPMREVKLYPI